MNKKELTYKLLATDVKSLPDGLSVDTEVYMFTHQWFFIFLKAMIPTLSLLMVILETAFWVGGTSNQDTEGGRDEDNMRMKEWNQ